MSTILHRPAARPTTIDLTTLPKCSPEGSGFSIAYEKAHDLGIDPRLLAAQSKGTI